MAASLSDFQETTRSPSEILHSILDRWDSVLPRLAADDPDLAGRWAELDMLRGETVRVDLGPSIVTGIGRGIDPEGALVLRTKDGEARLYGGRVLRTK